MTQHRRFTDLEFQTVANVAREAWASKPARDDRAMFIVFQRMLIVQKSEDELFIGEAAGRPLLRIPETPRSAS